MGSRKIENLFCRGPIAEYAKPFIHAPEFIGSFFLCAPKGFWLNFNNLALPINVLKKKRLLYSLDKNSHLQVCTCGNFSAGALALAKSAGACKVLCRKLPYSAIGCRGMVFFKQEVLIKSKSLEKNYKSNKRVGRWLFARGC